MPSFSSRLPDRFEPNELARLLAEKRAAGASILDLTESNPTRVGLATPPPDDWTGLLRGAMARYEPEPLGSWKTREAISAYYAERELAVPAEHIALTASTSEAYAHLFRIFAEPGEAFLIPEPSYPLFAPLAALEGVLLVPYPLHYKKDRWRVDLAALDHAIGDETRGVIVVHPNNPTGSQLSHTEAHGIEALCAARDLVIISDEVFGDFLFDIEDRHDSLVTNQSALTFVLAGLSKTCGVPQAKLAWMAMAGPEAAIHDALPRLEWVGDSFLSVSSAIQEAAPALLENRSAFQEAVRERIEDNLAKLDSLVSKHPEIDRLAFDGGWSVVLRVSDERSEEVWVRELLEQDVLLHPGHFYDFAEEAYLILSLLPDPDIFATGVERLCALALN
jgi:aspartate/methionine/tyrosine aminotransferase